MTQTITHDAVVKAIERECVRVTIVQASACGGCAARQMCNSAESKEKEVEVHTPDAAMYRVGQQVVLEGRLSDARAAAFWAYGLPLIIMLVALYVTYFLTNDDRSAGAAALATLVVYYSALYLLGRKRLHQRFSFIIRAKHTDTESNIKQ